MKDYSYIGFKELEEAGYDIERIMIDHVEKVIQPAWSAEDLELSFLKKGTKVRFLAEHGYDHERERAMTVMKKDDVFTVLKTKIGDCSSYYYFEEIPGGFNTVMFEIVDV